MPRPTPAQLVYGSATVFLSTLVMLLLSRTETGIGVAVIALAGLGIGVLVALTVPMPLRSRARRRAARADSPAAPAALPPRPPSAGRIPPARVAQPAGATEARVGPHAR
ncbi:hypothetical protein [Streptomyces celluloflavus]|uniref:Membrane transport protein MMPL domain-containing protein n=1 Tax=Streptomyces celluloflavus TaxID=58344 RepID=A0ABW7RIQ2_9ACTN|nr:hypothetical protein OG717_13505 [Streptomyces celluloflavus]